MTRHPRQAAQPGRAWKRPISILLLVLVLAVPLILTISNRGNETLALLLWYLLWLGNLVFRALPQQLFWVLFVCAALAIAAASLAGRRRKHRRQPAEEPDRVGRVLLMAHAVRRTDQGDYFKWRLARYLGGLAAEAVTSHGLTVADDRLDRLRGLSTDISPELMAYFEQGLGRGLLEPTSPSSRLKRWLGVEPKPTALDLAPDIAVRFLEEQLEVPYDQ